jgi:hypothetical protein
MNTTFTTLASLVASYDKDYINNDENEPKNKDVDENENENENKDHNVNEPSTIAE